MASSARSLPGIHDPTGIHEFPTVMPDAFLQELKVASDAGAQNTANVIDWDSPGISMMMYRMMKMVKQVEQNNVLRTQSLAQEIANVKAQGSTG